jgi:AcrR family transcriptional regulator
MVAKSGTLICVKSEAHEAPERIEPESTSLERMSLSELVERSGVPASTIHYYRRTGLIPPPVREAANRFRYDDTHLQALLEIRSHSSDSPELRERIVDAAIDAFHTHSYNEVTISDIAEACNMAKGSVYRYFESKEDLLTAAIEKLLDDTAKRFEETVESLGGAEGLNANPDKAALVFGHLLAGVLPILLELGARAAKGHEPSADLARKVLRTLAETGGRPFAPDGDVDQAVTAGLGVIERAFATVLSWAVGPDWPPDNDEP